MFPQAESSATTGAYGALRWHRTFIDVNGSTGEDPVDPRAFKTDPGFRGGRGQELEFAFSDEMAYVEGLAEKLSTWSAGRRSADQDSNSTGSDEVLSPDVLGARSTVARHDRAAVLTRDRGPSVPWEAKGAGPTEVAARTLPKSLSRQELVQRIRAKASLIARMQQRAPEVVDESDEQVLGDTATAHGADVKQAPPVAGSPQPVARTDVGVQEQRETMHTSVTNQAVAQMILQAKVSEQDLVSGIAEEVASTQLPLPSPSLLPSLNFGSFGHPELCLRPCLYFAAGGCMNGDSCNYCHLPHPKRPVHLDRRHREMLREMPLDTCAAMLLPVLRQRVQTIAQTPRAVAMVDDIAAACGLPVPHGPSTSTQLPGPGRAKRDTRMLVCSLKAMSLRLLLVTAGHALAQHVPEVDGMMGCLLEHLRMPAAHH